MKKLVALTVAVLTFAAIALPALAATKTVTVGDNFFVRKGSKPTVSVHRGDTVKWVWRGTAPHNVVVTHGPVRFQSATRGKGYVFSKRLTKSGTYSIVCTIHSHMEMTLKVS